jgi:hypothetical protein
MCLPFLTRTTWLISHVFILSVVRLTPTCYVPLLQWTPVKSSEGSSNPEARAELSSAVDTHAPALPWASCLPCSTIFPRSLLHSLNFQKLDLFILDVDEKLEFWQGGPSQISLWCLSFSKFLCYNGFMAKSTSILPPSPMGTRCRFNF